MDRPGTSSDVPAVSRLTNGVVGSTETTDLTGKTRSLAAGPIASKGESDGVENGEVADCCGVARGLRVGDLLAPHSCCFCVPDSENDR